VICDCCDDDSCLCLFCGGLKLYMDCVLCLGAIAAVAVGAKGEQVRTEKATEINIKQPIKIYTISN